MLIEDVAKLSIEDRFLYWIKEREFIRKRKTAGKSKPWTNDVILQSYKFCNVRRMDDKVSQWLMEHWYEPYFDHKNIVLAVAFARSFNLPSTLEHVGFPTRWSPKSLVKKIRKLQKDINGPVFTGAYLVYANDGEDGIQSVIQYNVDPLRGLKIDTDSMENTHRRIWDCHGFGSFMAGQITCDLRWALNGSWDDRNDWMAIGPGSARGLNRINQEPLDQSVSQSKFNKEFPRILKLVKRRLPKIYSRLEAVDVEHCLCEFDKYERTLFEGRRPRCKYTGTK